MDQSAAPLPPEKAELLDQVMAYVEQHLAERITLAEVARQFYVSESTITQAFRKRMDVSFYRCVTQRRLIAAKALIERGILLEAVAEQVASVALTLAIWEIYSEIYLEEVLAVLVAEDKIRMHLNVEMT